MLLKEIQDGDTLIQIRGLEDDSHLKENLIKVYDTVNDVARQLKKSITKNWFYTDQQIENLKKDDRCVFI